MPSKMDRIMSLEIMVNLEEKLKEFFGYNTFRSYQKEIIQAVLGQKDVLAILPTGAGKSLCYQLPAMLMPGTAIVVSPLISLMQDQVVSLFKNGIPAAFLNSSLHYQDLIDVLQNLSDYKLVYVAPERFADASFIQRLKEIQLSFFIIDEAHCISQWGHSFRAEYRKLSILRNTFPECPIMALTATATREVETDIMSQLAMKQPEIIKGSFDRPNLTIRINQKINVESQLLEFLNQQQDKAGIIYAATRKTVDSTFEQLKQSGFNVGRYHAGMTDQERSSSQHVFLHDQVTLMVATVAFGMGIHKPDIRFIIHLDMPKTIEQYYQEIGRAGRDGLPADCLMLYGTQDLILYKSFLEQLEDPIIRKQIKAKTEKMYSLCTSLKCRRKELLNYFGEQTLISSCTACDNCVDDVEMIDGTVMAQKILSCVFRLHQNFGIKTVIDVLRGSKSQGILNRGLDQLSTYGLLADLSEKELRYYVESLIHLNFLRLTEGDYPVLKWTETSKRIIDGSENLQFKKKIFKEAKQKDNQILHYDKQLFNELKQLRLEVAQQESVPPFVVFSDRSLQEMAVYFPKNQQEFSKVNGVGPIKWLKYGEKFLAKIQQCQNQQANHHFIPEKMASPLQRKSSIEETIRLYQEGLSLEEIIQTRQLAKSTILTHLAEGIQQGSDLDITRLVKKEHQELIEKVITEVGAEKLAPIKEKLSEDISYDEIRLVAAFHRRVQ
jgi:ATP-dependent DNA helicase RecQ